MIAFLSKLLGLTLPSLVPCRVTTKDHDIWKHPRIPDVLVFDPGHQGSMSWLWEGNLMNVLQLPFAVFQSLFFCFTLFALHYFARTPTTLNGFSLFLFLFFFFISALNVTLPQQNLVSMFWKPLLVRQLFYTILFFIYQSTNVLTIVLQCLFALHYFARTPTTLLMVFFFLRWMRMDRGEKESQMKCRKSINK